jgi:hypothetical protein
MGAFGSGRPSGFGRNKVEACRSIDVNRLHRERCLRPGGAAGKQVSTIQHARGASSDERD